MSFFAAGAVYTAVTAVATGLAFFTILIKIICSHTRRYYHYGEHNYCGKIHNYPPKKTCCR